MSLTEIADEHGISKQGVHDLIKRCTKSLQEYEDKLHMIKRSEAIRVQAEKLKNVSNGNAELISISDKILEELG
jgi:predicted DNA-binding protein YlxM (UPF0122 family)